MADDKGDSKSKILAAITGPYQLIGLLLLVSEGLLASWFFRAGTGVERGIAGLSMTVILFGVLYAIVRIKQDDLSASHPGGPMSIKPPDKEVTEQEIAAPSPDVISGPDRSYLIKLPPQGWRVRELTLSEWMGEASGITDPATREKLFPSEGESREILVLEREEQTSIVPFPGRTLINGRKLPSALETLVPTQLSIVSMERAQPPIFLERSMEHNFLTFLANILPASAMNVTRLRPGVNASGRRYLSCELQQKVQDAIVNDKEGQNVVVTTTVIGMQGELRDHLLIMKYATGSADAEVERNYQVLQDLVASFAPLKVANVEEARKEIAALADQHFQQVMSQNGQEIFVTEFRILLLRLQGVSLDDPEIRARTMKLLQPFEAFASETNLQDERLDALWKSLPVAQTGNATDFKAVLGGLISQAAASEREEQANAPALPAAAGAEPEPPAAQAAQAP